MIISWRRTIKQMRHRINADGEELSEAGGAGQRGTSASCARAHTLRCARGLPSAALSTCSACTACSWVLLRLRSFKFLPEKAVRGRASAGLNWSLLDSPEWLMAFSETDKSSHRPVSSTQNIAVTLRSLMSSVGSRYESRNRFEVAPCASSSPRTSQTGSEDQATLLDQRGRRYMRQSCVI